MSAPLEGIRIIDWTIVQMGPVATAMMVDLGATVIHVEQPVVGDYGRGLVMIGGVGDEIAKGRRAYFENNNRGKKGIVVDLTKEKGKEVMYRLVKNSDVFVHNFRQGVPEKLGLDYETLRQYNPRLIYVAASGLGPKGPDAREPTVDLTAQARCGIMTLVGEPGSPPTPVGGGIVDQMGAIIAAYGILAALVARERLGVGQKVDTSHLGSMITLLGLAISRRLYLGERATEWRTARTNVANPLWNRYQCKDGKWITLAMLRSHWYWSTVCKALGIEHLEKDPRFEDLPKRAENCEALIAIMDEIFMTRTVTEWMKILKETGDVICGPVQTLDDLVNDPQVLANDYIIDYNHEVLGPIKVVGVPFQLSKTPGVIRAEAPELGQHTEEVLIEIGGYSWEEITALREQEVI